MWFNHPTNTRKANPAIGAAQTAHCPLSRKVIIIIVIGRDVRCTNANIAFRQRPEIGRVLHIRFINDGNDLCYR